MGGKFNIKKQQPIASPVGRTPAKVVFGFSELKDISYTNGDNHVFLGYRQQNTFEVIFIEYNFGDIYSHE